MEGEGNFVLPHGVVYQGNMKDGQFHGTGVLIYPKGQMVAGEWFEGEIISWKFKYKGIEECRLENYCKQPDRRFLTTLYGELLPAGCENLTNVQPTKVIPPGCYDVVDGFYNPESLWVHSNKNFSRVLYMPASRRISADLNILKDDGTDFIKRVPFVPIYRTVEWIVENCRRAWDEPSGYKPELYEYWFTGRKAQRQKLNMRVEPEGGRFVWSESICDELLRNFQQVAQNRLRLRMEEMYKRSSSDSLNLFEEPPVIVKKRSSYTSSSSDDQTLSGKNTTSEELEDVDELPKKIFVDGVEVNLVVEENIIH